MSIEVAFRHTLGTFVLDVAFSVSRPGITALFGPSGGGKTTTVNVLAGLLKPREGRVILDDRVVLDTESQVFVPPRERRIGYVFQDARLFPHMSVDENLRFGWRRSRTRAGENTLAHVLDLLNLEGLLARRPSKLSGGERGRVALGRALLSNPVLLLLDEPLAALDAARRDEILPYLERLHREGGLPMIYVTHSVDEISRLADEVVVLNSGRVKRQARVFDILSDLEFDLITGVAAYGAVIETRIVEQRREQGLTVLVFEGGELVVPGVEGKIGSVLRIRARAEDILLAREAPASISANNVLPAKVSGIRLTGGAQADVQLMCGSTKMIARITQASLARLAVADGLELYAIIKSVTIDPRF